ncbi:hypothetical protein [Tsukamurella soli]|uniref:Uncharacterized protein n=1 Tax=Tsukamurella soli TaxID=644556 RepID=A0ABP8J007_9ACTN
MSDKSPRHETSKKPGKTLKEKRAEKHAKAAARSFHDQLVSKK